MKRATATPAFLLCTILLCGNVQAQDDPTRRIDPGEPVDPDQGSVARWVRMALPAAATGSSLGTLAVHPVDGTLYVWSMNTVASDPATPGGRKPKAMPLDERRIEPGDPTSPGEGGPGTADPTQLVSTLYQWADGVWTPRVVATREAGAFVHVTPYGDVYASTNLADGSVRIYHLSKTSSTMEALPPDVRGPAGPFAGDHAVFVRAGGAVLHRVGGQWQVELSCPEGHGAGTIASLGNGQLIAPCEGHEHFFDGTKWSSGAKWLPLDARSVWASRDVSGKLHLFAGSGAGKSGMQIWKFAEEEPGSLKGEFQLVYTDPSATTAPDGVIGGFWGTHLQEVYATGVAAGSGRLFQYNGTGWVNAAPTMELAATVGVAGAPDGDLFLSLADGTLLRRPAVTEIAEPTPRPAAALAVTSSPGSQARLEFTLAEARDVSIEFFDASGRRVDALSPGRLPEGVHRLTWSADRVASGMYFCRVDAGTTRLAAKVLIRK